MSFESEWTGFYGSNPPISWKLREVDGLRWQRFHSLPGSKRYAESDAEAAVILARHNTLAEAVLGEGAECWLVQVIYASANPLDDHSRYSTLPSLTRTGLEVEPVYADAELEDADAGWRVFAAPVAWRGGAFDALLASIANDAEPPTLWMARATGAAFAPYDGGVDLFLPTEEQKMLLRRRFAEWLSVHPAGL